MIKQLIRLANELDRRGLPKEADYVDTLIKMASHDDKFEELWHDFGEPVDLLKPRKVSDLTEDDLRYMTPEKYVEIVNAERRDRGKEEGHPLPMLEYDKETAFIKYNTALDMVRSHAISTISDVFKDINGIRPRHIKYNKMSLEELNKVMDDLFKEADDKFEEERLERELDPHGYDDRWAAEYFDDADGQRALRAEEEHKTWLAEEDLMRTPETGEEVPEREGMGRRFSEKYLDL